MKLKSLGVALLLSAGSVTVAGSAHAVNYVEVDGTNVKFLYDADFWGTNTASVTGNWISFDLSSDYTVAAKVKPSSPNGSAIQTYQESANLNLIVVAKDGYELLGGPDGKATASYKLAANNGIVVAANNGMFYNGTYSGGIFNAQSFSAFGIVDSIFSTGSATAGAYDGTTFTGDRWTSMSAMGLDISLASSAQQTGVGLSSSTMTNVSYGFAVNAVPEPETYAMLLAGLGVVAAIARRRQARA